MPLENQVNTCSSILQLNPGKKNPISGLKLDILLGFICLHKISQGQISSKQRTGFKNINLIVLRYISI